MPFLYCIHTDPNSPHAHSGVQPIGRVQVVCQQHKGRDLHDSTGELDRDQTFLTLCMYVVVDAFMYVLYLCLYITVYTHR